MCIRDRFFVGHVMPGVEGTYDRHEYLAEKADALNRLLNKAAAARPLPSKAELPKLVSKTPAATPSGGNTPTPPKAASPNWTSKSNGAPATTDKPNWTRCKCSRAVGVS